MLLHELVVVSGCDLGSDFEPRGTENLIIGSRSPRFPPRILNEILLSFVLLFSIVLLVSRR